MPQGSGSHHRTGRHSGGGIQRNYHYQYGYRRRPVRYGIGSLIIILGSIISVSVTLHYKLSASDDSDDFNGFRYAAVDTRIISNNDAFCQGLTLHIDESDYSFQVSLYTLRSPPKLSRHEVFSFTKSVELGFYDYQYFYYHMYEGSNFTVTACASNSDTSAIFYLVKGNSTFEKWTSDYNAAYTIKSFQITNLCGSGVSTTYNYTINVTDNYFMVFYAPYHRTYESLDFSADFYINRILYAVDNESIVDSCTLIAEDFYDISCSVSSPLSGSTSLLTVELPENYKEISFDFTDGILAKTSCSPRVWLYSVIAVAGFLTCGLLLLLLVLSICLCVKKNESTKNENYRVLSANSDNATTLPPDPNGLNQPPPIDPNYHSTNYGSTFEAPPMYTYKE